MAESESGRKLRQPVNGDLILKDPAFRIPVGTVQPDSADFDTEGRVDYAAYLRFADTALSAWRNLLNVAPIGAKQSEAIVTGAATAVWLKPVGAGARLDCYLAPSAIGTSSLEVYVVIFIAGKPEPCFVARFVHILTAEGSSSPFHEADRLQIESKLLRDDTVELLERYLATAAPRRNALRQQQRSR